MASRARRPLHPRGRAGRAEVAAPCGRPKSTAHAHVRRSAPSRARSHRQVGAGLQQHLLEQGLKLFVVDRHYMGLRALELESVCDRARHDDPELEAEHEAEK